MCVCPLPADDLMPIDSFMPGVHRRPNHSRIALFLLYKKGGTAKKIIHFLKHFHVAITNRALSSLQFKLDFVTSLYETLGF